MTVIADLKVYIVGHPDGPRRLVEVFRQGDVLALVVEYEFERLVKAFGDENFTEVPQLLWGELTDDGGVMFIRDPERIARLNDSLIGVAADA